MRDRDRDRQTDRQTERERKRERERESLCQFVSTEMHTHTQTFVCMLP